jgi:hypothetical protein
MAGFILGLLGRGCVRILRRREVVKMNTAVILTLTALCMVGLVIGALSLIPLIYAYGYAQNEAEHNQIKDDLTIARTNKVKCDTEMLITRRGKMDNEILVLEERLKELRRKNGSDDPFTPINY